MQGRRSFTFEYEGTYHNPRFYAAKVKFSLKLVNKTDGTGYQMYSVTGTDGTTTHSTYGPIIVRNRLVDFFFEKAVIEVLGGTEIEPSTQTRQITKLIHFHTTTKPEDAAFKYSNLTPKIRLHHCNTTASGPPSLLETLVQSPQLLELTTKELQKFNSKIVQMQMQTMPTPLLEQQN